MIITCPHCQTKYQVTYEAIGSAGRKVQCAHCHQAWKQRPLDGSDATPAQKRAFDAINEDALDEVMVAEERAVAEELARRLEAERGATVQSSQVDAAVLRKRQIAFTQRQSAMAAELPLARLRRTMRALGCLLLASVLGIGYFGRVAVVERFPEMAGVYEAVGLGVNVVGLDFSNVSSMRTLRDGKEVLMVSAQIVGLMTNPVTVPAVVVTLIDDQGNGIYEWSVSPSVRDLMAGERSTFDTQLTMPPASATRVRLSFAGGQANSMVAVPAKSRSQAPGLQTEPAAPAATEHSTLPEHQ
jgi:predicted Zn finger-like uncharacterized protein